MSKKQFKSTAQVASHTSVKKTGKKKKRKLKKQNIKSAITKADESRRELFTKKKHVKNSTGKVKVKKSRVPKITSLKKIKEPKTVGFGAISSESEPEQIDASWDIDENENKHNMWESAPSDLTSGPTSASDISDDLEESESDYDDEWNDDLQSVISSNEHQSVCSSEEKVGSRTSGEDDSRNSSSMDLANRKENVKWRHEASSSDVAHIQSMESISGRDTVGHFVVPSTLSLTNTLSLFEEIRRRAMDLASRSLYITPVPPDCNLERLKQLSPEITSCRLSYNPTKKNCRRYAFLEYSDPVAASAAQKSITGRLFAGRNMSAQPVRSQLTGTCGDWSQIDSRQLFVSGLHPDVTRGDLQRVFPKAELDYPFHSIGFPLGYAVAKFVNDAVAFESFLKTHQRSIRGQLIFVNYVIRSTKPAGSVISNATSSSSVARNSTSATTNSSIEKDQPQQKSLNSKANLSNQSDRTIMPNSKLLVAGTDSTSTQVSFTKPKVLIQAITDVVASDEDEEDVSCLADDLFTKLNRFDVRQDNEFLLHKRQEPASTSSHILTSLLNSRKSDPKSNALVGSKETVEDFEAQESGEEKDESDVSDHSSDSSAFDEGEDETESDDGVDENTESSETEDDDDVNHSDRMRDGNDKVDDRAGKSDEESENFTDSSTANPTSILFSRPPKASERAAMNNEPNFLESQIDQTLQKVLQSRRAAMRAVKTAGSKRLWSSDLAKEKRKDPTKFKRTKPFELPVPSKRQKL